MKNILTEGQSIMIPLKTESNNLEEIKAASNKLITVYFSELLNIFKRNSQRNMGQMKRFIVMFA